MAKVARTLEVSSPTVTLVLYGKATSRRVATEIARQAGVPLGRMFSRYQERRAA